MGVRPNLFTLFGIDNHDGSIPDDFYERQIFIPESDLSDDKIYIKDYCYDRQKNSWKWYSNVVFVGGLTRANKNLLGFRRHTDFDSDTFRALAMLYPEFMESGHKDLPVVVPSDLERRIYYNRPVYPCGDIEFQESWWYKQGYYKMTSTWAFVTKWLLDSLEIETDPRQYKWMLVWDWC